MEDARSQHGANGYAAATVEYYIASAQVKNLTTGEYIARECHAVCELIHDDPSQLCIAHMALTRDEAEQYIKDAGGVLVRDPRGTPSFIDATIEFDKSGEQKSVRTDSFTPKPDNEQGGAN